jgi:SAM-dependent methyltransferase
MIQHSEISSSVVDILSDVERYYASKLRSHGPTARGVDWNGPESQELRFLQLARIITDMRDGSVTDVGCGYGGLLRFLRAHGFGGGYVGTDISSDMIAAARKSCDPSDNAEFHVTPRPSARTDFAVASGLFNVRLDHSNDAWLSYVKDVLDILDQVAGKGFAFNALTAYSDEDKKRPDLYYMDPLWAFDYCKKRFARNVALLHDYGLYEFTVLVRK